MVESLKDVGTPFIADGDPAVAGEPGQGSFDHPAVPSQTLGAVDPSSCDPRLDAAPAQRSSAMREIIAFIGMELGRSPLRSPHAVAYRRHGIDHHLEELAVVAVGRAEPDGEWDALAVHNKVALAPRLAPVCWVRAGALSPLLAGTLALSRAARLQSMALAQPSRSSRTRCRPSHTPARCQSRSRRQQVMPQPQPISCGSISQGMPLRSTNRMPLRAARWAIRGRPPFGFGGSDGMSGAITAHRSSDTRGAAIPRQQPIARFVRRSKAIAARRAIRALLRESRETIRAI
jgi:hypothetical protein